MPKIKIVLDCPRCGGNKTGIIQFDFEPNKKAVQRFAKRGCYVKQYPPSEYKKHRIAPNCFCSECNYEWIGSQETKKLSYNEYYKYLESRGLDVDSLAIPKKQPWLMQVLSCFWDTIRWH